MVQISRFLTKTNDSQNTRGNPLLNSQFLERFSKFSFAGKDQGFKKLMKWARKSPQILGLIDLITKDIISDDIKFEPIKKESGRNKVQKAQKFWDDNFGLEVVEETLPDMFITGIGYNWLGMIDEKQLKEYLVGAISSANPLIEGKELEMKADSLNNFILGSSPEKFVQKLRHVASTTMTISTNETEVTGYVQRVGTNLRDYKVKEIMQFRLMPLDGKVYPFAPMEALLSEVYLLWLISQNYVSFFENGGKPDNVFILPKEIAGSKNHEYLINTLKKYKKIQNKHGNLVFTGDIEIEQLMKVEHQMENKDLALYLTGVLAMFYGVPVGRIPFLVGKAANNGDAGGLADSGYWRKISVWQSKIEDVYNRQLFIPFFGVKMRFGRGYKQDEVRESANDMTKTQVAEQRLRLGLWTVEDAGDYLGIDPETIVKAQEEKKLRDEEEMKTNMLMQNQETNQNVMKEPDNKQKAKKKQDTQNKNQQNAGGKSIKP